MKIEIFSFVMGMVLMLGLVVGSLILGVSVVGAADRQHKKNESEDR